MESLFKDIRYGVRSLLKRPGFTATAVKNARALFAAFGQYPEQAVAERRFSSVRYRVKDGNLFIPVSVNSRSSTYIVDTGAAFSTLSESEATRLGLAIHDASGHEAGDSAGLKFGVRIAIADRLKVGNVQLRHVPFQVVRDDQQPFIKLPAGKQGVLGLPVLLALETMRWRERKPAPTSRGRFFCERRESLGERRESFGDPRQSAAVTARAGRRRGGREEQDEHSQRVEFHGGDLWERGRCS